MTDVKSQQIIAAEITSNSYYAESFVPELLTHIEGKVVSLCGNGAYYKRNASCLRLHPLRRNARCDQNGDWGSYGIYRNDAIFTSRVFGSDTWKEQVNYHQRFLVETAMFRIKRLFGERLKNRTLKNQWGETMVKTNALNMLTVVTSVYFS